MRALTGTLPATPSGGETMSPCHRRVGSLNGSVSWRPRTCSRIATGGPLVGALLAGVFAGGLLVPAGLRAASQGDAAEPPAAVRRLMRRVDIDGAFRRVRDIRLALAALLALRADNHRLRAKLETDAADARAIIDRQAAMIDELQRRLQVPARPDDGSGSDPYWPPAPEILIPPTWLTGSLGQSRTASLAEEPIRHQHST